LIKGYVYDHVGKTDPFKPFIVLEEVKEENKEHVGGALFNE